MGSRGRRAISVTGDNFSIHPTVEAAHGRRKGEGKATHEAVDGGCSDGVDKLDDQLDHENDDQ